MQRFKGLMWGLITLFLSSLAIGSTTQSVGDPNKFSTTPDNPDCKFFDGFSDNGDGTVTDPRNGLIWKRCSEGATWSGTSCNIAGIKMSWFEAMQSAKESRFLGKSDWRVPTFEELELVTGGYYTGRGTDVKQACAKNLLEKSQYAASSILTYAMNTGKDSLYFFSTTDHAGYKQKLTIRFTDGYSSGTDIDTPFGAAVRLVRSSLSSNRQEFESEYQSRGVAQKIAEIKLKEAEKARAQAIEVAEERALQAVLNRKDPQSMYLAAGKYDRDGESSKANQVYERLISRFPSSQWAIKANDQLLQNKRLDSANSARTKEMDKISGQCRERIANCNWSCASLSTSSSRDYCRGQCTSLCSP